MVKVLFKRLNQKAKLPSYKTAGSSGMDLMACIDQPITIKPNESKLVPTGIAIAIPEDTEVQIRPRSGLAAKSSISVLNTPGTIDSDYRGELKIILFNHGKDEFIVNDEDRVAQMVLMPILKVEIEETMNYQRQLEVLEDLDLLVNSKCLVTKTSSDIQDRLF